MKNGLHEIKIWTDGSATLKGNKLGGSGVYMKYDTGEEKMYSKGWENTKTGRAEIHAFLLALSKLENKPCSVIFYMDSEYVIKSVLEYLPNWIKNNWMGYAGPVKNKDLWEKVLKELDRLPSVMKAFVHVKGHQDNIDNEIVFGNNIVDYLADYRKQKNYELDLPKKEFVDLPLYYYLDPVNLEGYVGSVRKEGSHLFVGKCTDGKYSEDEFWDYFQERSYNEDFHDENAKIIFIGEKESVKGKCYYLHRPSRTYFIDEKDKVFEEHDQPNILLIGDCVEGFEFELRGLLQKTNILLYKTFDDYKLRGIKLDNEDLPF